MEQKHIITAGLGLCASLLALAPTTGSAEETWVVYGQRDLPTAYVSYRDLNLSEPNGVARLQRRVRRAAVELCDFGPGGAISVMFAERACTKDAVLGAQDQIDRAIASYGSKELASRAEVRVALRR